MNWQQLFTDVGVLAGLVIFFTWTGWHREQKLSDRIDELDSFVRQKLLGLIEESKEHLKLNSDALKESAKSNGLLAEAIGKRPCFIQDDQALIDALERISRRERVLRRRDDPQP